MIKTKTLLFGSTAALLLSVSAAEAAPLPLSGTPNPDAAAIAVVSRQVIEVRATGSQKVVPHPLANQSPYADDMATDFPIAADATPDIRNVQWAVQNVRGGGTVRLKPGAHGEAFNFGASAIYLPGINLVGSGFDHRGFPRTTIAGGAEGVRVNFTEAGDEVRIEGLWFRASIGHSVISLATTAARFELIDNKFTDAQVQLTQDTPFTEAFAIAYGTVDRIVLRGNSVDSIDAPVTDGGDTCLEVVSNAYKSIEISDNHLRTQGLGVFVWANTNPAGEIVVRRNTIEGVGKGSIYFPTTGIWVLGDEGARVEIAENRQRLTGYQYAFLLSHETPGADYIVRDNETLSAKTVRSVIHLGFEDVGLGQIADTLSGARFEGNTFAGDAPIAIDATDYLDNPFGAPYFNRASGNRFLRNDFARLSVPAAPAGCKLDLGPSTSNNLFDRNAGLALDCDLGTNNRLVAPSRGCDERR